MKSKILSTTLLSPFTVNNHRERSAFPFLPGRSINILIYLYVYTYVYIQLYRFVISLYKR